MDKLKFALTFIGVGVVAGAVIVLALIVIFGAKPSKVNVGPIEFEIPTATPPVLQPTTAVEQVTQQPTATSESPSAPTTAATAITGHIFADYFNSDTLSGYERTGVWVWDSASENVRTDGVPASDSRMYAPVNIERTFSVVGRVYVPESGVGPYDSISVALRNNQVEYWGILLYGTNLVERNNITISRNDVGGDLYPLTLTSGWYTVKMQVDQSTKEIRLKVWADGTNEPDWQVTQALDLGWTATGIGFRHAGDGTTWVDDIYAIAQK